MNKFLLGFLLGIGVGLGVGYIALREEEPELVMEDAFVGPTVMEGPIDHALQTGDEIRKVTNVIPLSEEFVRDEEFESEGFVNEFERITTEDFEEENGYDKIELEFDELEDVLYDENGNHIENGDVIPLDILADIKLTANPTNGVRNHKLEIDYLITSDRSVAMVYEEAKRGVIEEVNTKMENQHKKMKKSRGG